MRAMANEIHPTMRFSPTTSWSPKSEVSVFVGSGLDVVLRSLNVDTLVLAGIQTSGVVLSTLRRAADLDDEPHRAQRRNNHRVGGGEYDDRSDRLRRVQLVSPERRRIRPTLCVSSGGAAGVRRGGARQATERVDMEEGRTGAGARCTAASERPCLGHRGFGSGPSAGGHRSPRTRPLRRARRPPRRPISARGNAVDIAAVFRQLAPEAKAVVGMSLGGITTIALSSEAPELVRKVVLVDILPGIKAERAKHITDFVSGPPSFASLDELLERTARFNPTRSQSSLQRGILHNAEQQPDGTWVWRWARHHPAASPASPASLPDSKASATRYEELWEAVSRITVPLLLARGMRPDSVLDDEDERELRRRLPSAQIAHVEGAGHSLQGDTPLELAALIEQFVFGN